MLSLIRLNSIDKLMECIKHQGVTSIPNKLHLVGYYDHSTEGIYLKICTLGGCVQSIQY